MSCFAKVAVCFALLFALADCGSFEELVHERGLKDTKSCWLVYMGTDWAGGDIADPVSKLGWATECCAHCNEHYGNRVKAYIYRTDYDKCYCKEKVNPPSACSSCQGRNYFEQKASSDCKPVYNYDTPGNDLPRMPIVDVTQPEECCKLCRRYGSLCVAWAWRRDQNNCWLKKIPGKLVYNPASVYGNPWALLDQQ